MDKELKTEIIEHCEKCSMNISECENGSTASFWIEQYYGIGIHYFVIARCLAQLPWCMKGPKYNTIQDAEKYIERIKEILPNIKDLREHPTYKWNYKDGD